jgi:hypothetical protein
MRLSFMRCLFYIHLCFLFCPIRKCHVDQAGGPVEQRHFGGGISRVKRLSRDPSVAPGLICLATPGLTPEQCSVISGNTPVSTSADFA